MRVTEVYAHASFTCARAQPSGRILLSPAAHPVPRRRARYTFQLQVRTSSAAATCPRAMRIRPRAASRCGARRHTRASGVQRVSRDARTWKSSAMQQRWAGISDETPTDTRYILLTEALEALESSRSSSDFVRACTLTRTGLNRHSAPQGKRTG
eukprot:460768-Pleurochrysis_carterae.AAC.1